MNFGFAIWDFGLRRKAVRETIWSESLSVNNLKSKIQKLKWLGIVAIAFTSAFDAAEASALQPGKIFRIGFLDQSTASGMAVLLETFRQELIKFGWGEGKNITIEYRFAEQKNEKLPELAVDVVSRKVDIIVVAATPAALAAKNATQYRPDYNDNRCRPR